MTERNLRAYYYGFNPTGDDTIDSILEAVAQAGKAYHNTEDWSDTTWDGRASYANQIQKAADEAAKYYATRASE